MNIYQTLYDLINNYVFAGEIVAETVPDLVTTLLSTCGTIFVVAIPFILIWKLLTLIGGR